MADTPALFDTRLVALDWGTSSLRAFRLDGKGQVQEQRHRPWGIMNLPQAPDGHTDAEPRTEPGAAFERALQDTCGDWLTALPSVPVLACGMVGSAQGWREAKYLDAPTSLDALARGLTVVHRGNAMPVHIVPGLLQRGALPNVMRGEETQVLGVLADTALAGPGPVLVGLPGTHSKWVVARQHGIEQFHTFMTGEVFAALRGHTILGKTMQAPAEPDDAAFVQGLQVARGSDAALGLLSHIFSTRTLGLTGDLPATAQADYLSGLLIGHEMVSLARLYPPAPHTSGSPMPLVLCGESDLCRRYAIALQVYGFAAPTVAAQATVSGLWHIAQAAGLVAHRQPFTPILPSQAA
ncbi:2-dehydro-3-deoxygalactonokinase [Acidovorax sp. 106]|uniref:2-dehydro-3-deoxygalactonokinase n=1 Tax=Acidovorax sp. 106 TaxID=2135637 RepID=UPI000EAE458B|nr:2-dehydro-3-deoxygalactonokinase [Acidovorax sp. 106]RLJ37042.1 2-dehydro-3-deoxygalactonokinase [Acidovorax sp. 106]